MVRILLGLLSITVLLVEMCGCATACQKGDDVCFEKQSGEYGRPYYVPPEADAL